ncbi:hypothetical protein Mapa_008438 [Marchantia paleacea]|nr:hypothetical protein Mapa_008438 [Marchantia paleacea]
MATPHADEETIYNAKLLSETMSKADMGSVEIPAEFLTAPESRANISHDCWAEVPVLDFSKAETDEAGLAKKMVDAFSDCGFFSFINHSVPMGLIEEIQAEGQKFFTLPLEEKQKVGQSEFFMGYSGDFRNYNLECLLWNEALQMDLKTTQPEDFASKVWPEGDPKFSAAVRNYVAAVKKVQHYIFELLAVGLGLERSFFAEHFSPEVTPRDMMRLNYYATCPKPMDVLGAHHHTDTVTLTILHDGGIGGLQVEMNGEWKGIEPIKGALICNAGDIIRLWSNDRFKSALHRVVVNDSKPRMSTVLFVNPGDSSVVSAPASLAEDIGQPRRYKNFNMEDFFRAYAASPKKAKSVKGLEVVMQAFANGKLDDSVDKSHSAESDE